MNFEITSRKIILGAIAFSGLLVTCGANQAAAQTDKPNVVPPPTDKPNSYLDD